MLKKLLLLYHFVFALFCYTPRRLISPAIMRFTVLQYIKSNAIKVDGELDETSWKQSAVAENFWQLYPCRHCGCTQTKVRMTYDANNLYVAFVCYDTGYYVIQSLKRDSDPGSSDGVGIVLDPLNSRTNGFSLQWTLQCSKPKTCWMPIMVILVSAGTINSFTNKAACRSLGGKRLFLLKPSVCSR